MIAIEKITTFPPYFLIFHEFIPRVSLLAEKFTLGSTISTSYNRGLDGHTTIRIKKVCTGVENEKLLIETYKTSYGISQKKLIGRKIQFLAEIIILPF